MPCTCEQTDVLSSICVANNKTYCMICHRLLWEEVVCKISLNKDELKKTIDALNYKKNNDPWSWQLGDQTFLYRLQSEALRLGISESKETSKTPAE